MKTTITILSLLAVCGCGKPPAPAPPTMTTGSPKTIYTYNGTNWIQTVVVWTSVDGKSEFGATSEVENNPRWTVFYHHKF